MFDVMFIKPNLRSRLKNEILQKVQGLANGKSQIVLIVKLGPQYFGNQMRESASLLLRHFRFKRKHYLSGTGDIGTVAVEDEPFALRASATDRMHVQTGVAMTETPVAVEVEGQSGEGAIRAQNERNAALCGSAEGMNVQARRFVLQVAIGMKEEGAQRAGERRVHNEERSADRPVVLRVNEHA
jgi:hypothetical protein